MFQGASETQELRALYDFGELGSANNRGNGRALAQAPAQAPAPPQNHDASDRESSGNDAQEYSPREDSHYNQAPTSPAAFGSNGDTYVNTSSAPAPAGVAAAGGKKSKGAKTAIIKEVLGTNRKNTKGMTEEQKKAVDLEQRWQNALREEQRLNDLEQRASQAEVIYSENAQQPNFPRKFLCIRPLVYHSMSAVPEHRKLFVTMAFWDWVAVCILLAANAGVAIGVNYAPVRKDVIIVRDVNKALNFVLALVYLVGVPLSFLIWYWRVYTACSTGRPPQHVLAMCGLLIALAQAIFALVGPTSYGVAGIMLAEWIQKTRETGVVAPVAIMAVLWAAQAVFTCFMLVKVFIYYRKDLAARRVARRYQPNVVGA